MAHGHGGARRYAGRKRNTGTALLRQLMDEAIGTQRWKQLLKRVIAHIEKTGDASAFYRLATLRFGIPTQSSEPDSDPEPLVIREVVVNLPYNPEKDSPETLNPPEVRGTTVPQDALEEDEDTSATNDDPVSVKDPVPYETGREHED